MKILVFTLPLLLFAFTFKADKVKLFADKQLSSISYDMNHPMHAWTGVSKSVSSAIVCLPNRDSITQVAVTVKISTFDSDNSNRDSHAMEVTEALKYPSISFLSTVIKYESAEKIVVTGNLKFHGVSKSISFPVNKKMVGEKAEITGEFQVKMTDYGIDPPTLMGIATDDEFKIHFKMFY